MAKLPSQFNRAFDLSSLKPPPPVSSGEIIECNERIFIEQLIPLSKERVVILVLWTPRSSDSVLLVETLASLAQRDSQRWQLATVNADTEAAIVQALRATGVPMTVALIAGQVAPLFDGLIAPEELPELIEKVIGVAKKQGVGIGKDVEGQGNSGALIAPGDEEPEITAAYGALAVNDLNRAKTEFEHLLSRKPGDHQALQGIANVELLERITGHEGAEIMAKAVIQTDDVAIQRLAADFEFLSGDISGAFARLINQIHSTAGDEQDLVRLHVLSLFAVLESDDPELVKARSALARALF